MVHSGVKGWVLFALSSVQIHTWPDQLSQHQIQCIFWNRFSSVALVLSKNKYNFVTKLTSCSSNTIKNYQKPDLSLSTRLLTVSLFSINGLCFFSISLVRRGKNSFHIVPSYSHSKAFNMFKHESRELLALSTYYFHLSKGRVKSSLKTL